MADTAVHAAAAGHDDHHGGHHTSTGLSNNKLAMWLFLGSECLLFGGLISTIGAFILGFGVLIFFYNAWRTHFGKHKAPPAPLDPWDARSLEWMTASPPKEINFDRTPVVSHLDEFFHRKYEDKDGDHAGYEQVMTAEEVLAVEEANAEDDVHLPSPSYWPLILAVGIMVICYGVIYSTLLLAAGAAIAILALFGWALEPPTADDSEFDPPSPDGGSSNKELAHV